MTAPRIKDTWFLLFIALLFSCQADRQNSNPAEVLKWIIQADNKGDLEKVMALYDKDAVLMPAGEENITGQAAIRENYKTIFETRDLQLHPRINELIETGDYAVIRGTITGKASSKTDSTETIVNDKFLMALKKDRKSNWKIHHLMWSRQNAQPVQ